MCETTSTITRLTQVLEVIYEIDENTWMLGDSKVIHRVPLCEGESYLWKDGNRWGFRLSDPPSPLPERRPLSTYCEFNYQSGIFVNFRHPYILHSSSQYSPSFVILRFGEASLKIVTVENPEITTEFTTVNWMNQHGPWSFSIPRALFRMEHEHFEFYLVTTMYGRSLRYLWTSLSQAAKHKYCQKVAIMCQEMTLRGPKREAITGVDGKPLGEPSFCKNGERDEFRTECLEANAREAGMDVSDLVLYNCQLDPSNIIVNSKTDTLGVLQWDLVGFVPRVWVATKFKSSTSSFIGESPTNRVDFFGRRFMDTEYGDLVSFYLGPLGLPDIAGPFDEWRRGWIAECGMRLLPRQPRPDPIHE